MGGWNASGRRPWRPPTCAPRHRRPAEAAAAVLGGSRSPGPWLGRRRHRLPWGAAARARGRARDSGAWSVRVCGQCSGRICRSLWEGSKTAHPCRPPGPRAHRTRSPGTVKAKGLGTHRDLTLRAWLDEHRRRTGVGVPAHPQEVSSHTRFRRTRGEQGRSRPGRSGPVEDRSPPALVRGEDRRRVGAPAERAEEIVGREETERVRLDAQDVSEDEASNPSVGENRRTAGRGRPDHNRGGGAVRNRPRRQARGWVFL